MSFPSHITFWWVAWHLFGLIELVSVFYVGWFSAVSDLKGVKNRKMVRKARRNASIFIWVLVACFIIRLFIPSS